MRCARGSHRLQKRQEQARVILARISRTLDSASSSVGPPGRSSTVGPDRGVEGASERWSLPGNGDHRASSHRADDSPHPSRARLPLARHVPRRNASKRVTASEKLRASRETGKCKVGRASRVIGESISMTRFEPSSKTARSEAPRSGIRWDLRVPSKHPSFADDVDEHLVSRFAASAAGEGRAGVGTRPSMATGVIRPPVERVLATRSSPEGAIFVGVASAHPGEERRR